MTSPVLVEYGSLQCIQFDSGPDPQAAVVICHGYGAPGTDLAGLGPEWISLLGPETPPVRFVFPAAPHDLADIGMPGGRAWWQLNMARLQQLVMAERFSELHDEEPPGMVDARDQLCEAIQGVLGELGGDSTPLVIGGFSQGAMVTMDAATCGAIPPPNALILFSGTVVRESEWKNGLSRLAGTKVYQSHGTVDPVLPYTSAERLAELFTEADVQSEFHSFVGPHTIDPESIAKTAMLISEITRG